MNNILMTAVAMLVNQRAARRNADCYASDGERTAQSDARNGWNTMLPGNLPPEPLSVLIDAALGKGNAREEELRRRAR